MFQLRKINQMERKMLSSLYCLSPRPPPCPSYNSQVKLPHFIANLLSPCPPPRSSYNSQVNLHPPGKINMHPEDNPSVFLTSSCLTVASASSSTNSHTMPSQSSTLQSQYSFTFSNYISSQAWLLLIFVSTYSLSAPACVCYTCPHSFTPARICLHLPTFICAHLQCSPALVCTHTYLLSVTRIRSCS